jgi:hypothetical protein
LGAGVRKEGKPAVSGGSEFTHLELWLRAIEQSFLLLFFKKEVLPFLYAKSF